MGYSKMEYVQLAEKWGDNIKIIVMAKQENTVPTKKCRFCQTEIDANATICPSCRKEQKKKMPVWLVILLVVIALCALSGIVGSGNKNGSTGTSTNGSGSTTSNNPQDGDFSKPYAKGAKVTLGDVSWQIVDSKNLGNKLKSTYGGDACVSESGNYIYMKVTVTNNSKDMITVSNLNLYDSEKRELTSASNVFGCIKDQLFLLENINPGISKTLTQVFEAPKDSKSLLFKATDLKFLNVKEAYMDLGL